MAVDIRLLNETLDEIVRVSEDADDDTVTPQERRERISTRLRALRERLEDRQVAETLEAQAAAGQIERSELVFAYPDLLAIINGARGEAGRVVFDAIMKSVDHFKTQTGQDPDHIRIVVERRA